MTVDLVNGLRLTVRMIGRRFGARALVLLYHRVIALPSDPYLICVTPQHFAEHLEVLRQRYHVVPLTRLAESLRERSLSRRTVVVTFDDGYIDNLRNAKPLLERYDVPATVFVASGSIDSSREFWWDELERLLLQPGELPQTLRLNLDGATQEWQVGAAAVYDEASYRRQCSWNVEQDGGDPRQRLFRDLYGALFPLSAEAQRQMLEQIREQAKAEQICRPTHRTVTGPELVELSAGGLVEIGSHTVTHPVLSSCARTVQQDEIRASKAHLEQIIGQPVASFAYPFGLRSTYTDETIAAVREAGFACACSNFVDVVSRKTDRFQLPRLSVQDWDGDAFARLLREWLG